MYIYIYIKISQSVQLISRIRLFATPWTATHQASLSITNSWSLLKFMSIELAMPSNHLILCHPLLILPLVFPSIRVFSYIYIYIYIYIYSFPGGSVVKNLPANAGDARNIVLIPRLGRSPWRRNSNLLQYSCLKNPVDRGAWQATVHGITECRT